MLVLKATQKMKIKTKSVLYAKVKVTQDCPSLKFCVYFGKKKGALSIGAVLSMNRTTEVGHQQNCIFTSQSDTRWRPFSCGLPRQRASFAPHPAAPPVTILGSRSGGRRKCWKILVS